MVKKCYITLLLLVCYLMLYQTQNLDFYQNEYDIILDRAECSWYNKSIHTYFNISFVLYNRTQRVLNGTFDLIQDLSWKTILEIQVYKFVSNEYRFFPVTVNVNACTEYSRNTFHIKDIFSKHTNFDLCNLHKGQYYIKNAKPDSSTFPPHLPRGMYKMTCTNRIGKVRAAQLDFYATLKDKPQKWSSNH